MRRARRTRCIARWTAAVVAVQVLSSLSGCSALTRTHRIIAAAADVTAVVGGVMVIVGVDCEGRPATLDPRDHDCDSEDRMAGAGVILVGLAAATGLFLILDSSS